MNGGGRMRLRLWWSVLILVGLGSSGALAREGAKSRAICDPPRDDPTTSSFVMNCFVRGFGAYDLTGSAGIRGGDPTESASLSVWDDGKPCSGPPEPQPLTSRKTISATCKAVIVSGRESFVLRLQAGQGHRIDMKARAVKVTDAVTSR